MVGGGWGRGGCSQSKRDDLKTLFDDLLARLPPGTAARHGCPSAALKRAIKVASLHFPSNKMLLSKQSFGRTPRVPRLIKQHECVRSEF